MGTLDGTGSSVEFSSIAHENGLAVVNLNGKTVPQTYYYDGNTGNASSVRAASTTTATVWPSVNFSSSTKPYSSSNTSSLKRYLAIVKPSTATTISTTATSGCEAWSLSYNVSQNTSSSQFVTSSRPGYYLGWVFGYTGAAQTLNVQETGKYKVECWGASGGSAAYDNLNAGYTTPVSGGAGGYCSGEINLKAIPYYIYVGHAGSSLHTETEFNGGGGAAGTNANYCCSSGGGATDFRLTYSSEWSNFESLKSRIIVAAGGGGAQHYLIGSAGGYGGGLSGDSGHYTTCDFFKSSDILPTGGTQTAGGAGGKTDLTTGISGGFGYGGAGLLSEDHGGGGGGGYYGGGGGNYRSGLVFSGAGGSSFISGHSGCNAISQASTSSKIVHTGRANHYSGYVFTNTVMKAGNETMPSPSGGRETGHTGNGYAIITQLSY